MSRDKRLQRVANGSQKEEEEGDNLLVFGYQCKIFRDDERARFIDQGLHLIPWMNDSTLTIDRYDGRGHLYDLKPYDADVMRASTELSSDEAAVEKACDEERYLELNVDMAERQAYEEEEMKRLYEGLAGDGVYKAVGFSYDELQEDPAAEEANEKDATTPEEENVDDADDDDPYEEPADLKVPDGMITPKTMRISALIEKTANFIARQGNQMEIMLKTKQANNRQLDFLTFSSELNPYYKHVVRMIRSGRYKPQPTPEKLKRSKGTPVQEPEPPPEEPLEPIGDVLDAIKDHLPQIQTHNTAYAKLLAKLSKHTGHLSPCPQRSREESPSNDVAEGTEPRLRRSLGVSAYGGGDDSLTEGGAPPPPGMEPVALPNVHQPPPPGTDYNPQPGVPFNNYAPPDPPPSVTPTTSEAILPHGVLLPPPDMIPIIEKMAEYVAKNGAEFELTVRSKNDTRFEFLYEDHPFHRYYEFKKSYFVKHDEPDQGVPKAVSFSIRTKENNDPAPLTNRTALPNDSSGEDDEDGIQVENSGSSALQAMAYHYSSSGDVAQQHMQPPPPPPPAAPLTQDEIDRRAAQDRLRDRLSAAAREKLHQAAKEQNKQAERKRKAAMFAAMLKQNPDTLPDQDVDNPKPPVERSSPAPVRLKRSRSRERRRRRSRSPRHRRRSKSPKAEASNGSPPSMSLMSAISSRHRSRSRSPRHKRRSSRDHRRHHRRSRSRSRDRHRHRRGSPSKKRRHRRRSRTRSSSRSKRRKRTSASSESSPTVICTDSAPPSPPTVVVDDEGETTNGASTPAQPAAEDKVNMELLTKVRAMLKAQRKEVMKDVF